MPPAPRSAPRRAPAGAAVLREDVTAAIRGAVFEELAAVGYGRMSIEAVARRAGVGKTAVYRRWPAKLDMVVDLILAVAVQDLPAPDTGTLRGDLRLLLGMAARALLHPLASQIIPDLLAEAARNPEITRKLDTVLHGTQRRLGTTVLLAAGERGELPPDTDVEPALDLIIGPLYWRLAVTRTPLTDDYLDRLTTTTVAALRAAVEIPDEAADEAAKEAPTQAPAASTTPTAPTGD
ncbi:TetR/AcrR family transcriptional regulator [Embleya sp. NBC_00896]|uniref:TetR/AcrR family transcriptional regulator n=1 Tax=Embleya sp. NBC_00896 TaxID=2975961 RepID=UPI00386F035B|nr:TetR/AcrR family transcriptional regulator [Embleya sp. NBC_00896]